jgi:predicted nucleic acid-binding Zn ribbon protein
MNDPNIFSEEDIISEDLREIIKKDINKVKNTIYGETIYFILYALTITVSLNWSKLISKIFEKYANKNSLFYEAIFTFILTLISVLIHVHYSKYATKPQDI